MKFRLLDIFQHHPLAALLLNHTLVIGQVVSGSLDSMAAVSSAQDFIYHPDGRGAP